MNRLARVASNRSLSREDRNDQIQYLNGMADTLLLVLAAPETGSSVDRIIAEMLELDSEEEAPITPYMREEDE